MAERPVRRLRPGAWPLYAALLCAYGCFMEGYGLQVDAGSADTAAEGEPPATMSDGARDAGEVLSGGDPDGGARAPTRDGAVTQALDGGGDSGRDGGANDAGGGDSGQEMDGASAPDAALADASSSGTPDADAGDASRDAGPVNDSGSACSGATTCAPRCNASPCALACADAGTCDVICQTGQTCDIECASAGTCNVTCQAGAVCHTRCTNIQFCQVDCQQGANCVNTCATGAECGFSPFCTQSLKRCGQIAACGDNASC